MATNDSGREIINRYLDRMPKANEAYLHDPTYHAQMVFMDRVLTAVDMAMEDEDVPREVRLRVLRAVMYNAPDEAEALGRVERTARLTDEKMAEVRRGEWLPGGVTDSVRAGVSDPDRRPLRPLTDEEIAARGYRTP